VIKDGGDDPDVTHGAEIVVDLELTSNPNSIEIDGGEGVGRITKPGIGLEIGQAAINQTPRKMITENLILTAKEILEKNNCTWFIPRVSKLDARKKWIIGSVSPKGALIIDNGAIQAIKNGKSLLPVGIKAIDGKFEKGDHIKVLDLNDKEYARGLSSFSSDEINKIKGSQSNQIKKILGYSSKDEVIHKDDLVKV